MAKSGYLGLATAAWLAVLAADAGAVHLRGSLLHVGFPGSGADETDRGSHYYRVGDWVPVLVELTNDDADRLAGRIEVRQPDRDGDEVVARRDVVVQGSRRFFLYVPGGRFEQPERFAVSVFDEDGRFARLHDDAGQPIRELVPPWGLLPAPRSARVILDVSPVRLLRPELISDDRLVRPVVVLHLSPQELPDEAAGLGMVDTVVWDSADPKGIDLAQRRAMMDWVRRGGTLALGVSRDWDRVMDGAFGEMLPARLHGTAMMADTPEFLAALLGISAFDTSRGRLDPPLTYCPVTRGDLAPEATALVPSEDEPAAVSRPADVAGPLLVTQRPFGAGRVILVAAQWRDLLDRGRRNAAMLRDLLGLRVRPGEPRKQLPTPWTIETDLFDSVEQKTAFAVTAGLYFLFAFGFITVYIALATAGGWFWLKRQGAARHAWNVFALVALAASGVSLLAVQWIRGFTYRVQELSVVDARAGSDWGMATSYFGLKAPAHRRLDLRLPDVWARPDEPGEAPCDLRPLPPVSEDEGVYSASERYEAVASLGDLRGVPVRATLKQFEGTWCGRLPGRLEASLRYTRRGSLEIDPSSWVENHLGTDLYDCYLLVTSQSVQSNRPHRDLTTEVAYVGRLAQGARIVWQDLAERAAAPQGGRPPPPRMQLARILSEDWLRSLAPAGQIRRGAEASLQIRRLQEHFAKALLLLTIYDEIDMDRSLAEGSELTRSGGVGLDRTRDLSPETALFVGFSRDAGPARLCWRPADEPEESYRALVPRQANVMYRILVPVETP